MSSIEEDIKRCEQLTRPEHASWIGISNQLAILHVLEEYTRQKQINEEHQKINGELREKVKQLEAKLEFQKFGDLDNIEFEEYMNQFIPKQVVIDKIKENKQILDKTNDGNLRERLYIENGIMKELLEGERK